MEKARLKRIIITEEPRSMCFSRYSEISSHALMIVSSSEEDYACLGYELYSDFLSCFSLKCPYIYIHMVKGIQVKSNSIYDTISVRYFQQQCIYRYNKKCKRNVDDICTKEIAYLLAVATKCIWMLVQEKFVSPGSAEAKITQDLLIPLL